MKKRSVLFFCLLAATHVDAQWLSSPTGSSDTFNSTYFVSQDTGFAVGQLGEIIKTTNGGNTWVTKVTATGNYGFNSVFFANGNFGIAAGYGSGAGKILRTTDGGDHWTPITIPNAFLTSVFFVNPSIGYCVNGTNPGINWLYKTIDGGTTWTQLPLGNYYPLNSIYFPTTNTGYTVGKDGVIFKTSNAGANWNLQPIATNNKLISVCFVDSLTGYTVGAQGVTFKTTDGGANWVSQNSGTANNLNAVYFINANVGYAVGDGGVMIKTTDGGATWSAQNSITTYKLFSIHFADLNTGYASGEMGVVLKTVTGGATWVEEHSVNETISAFPNPASDIVTIQNKKNQSGKYELSLRNIQGQVIISKAIEFTDLYQLELEQIENGIYFLSLENGQERMVKKIVVQR